MPDDPTPNIPGTNTGHGHVWKLPGGVKARCGGPAICAQCKADQGAMAAANMSEPNCICGHPKKYHDSPGQRINAGCAGLKGHSECYCQLYRECHPWPDSVGVWWCSEFADLPRVFGGKSLYVGDSWWSKEEFERQYGPAHFTKLLEANPFKEP